MIMPDSQSSTNPSDTQFHQNQMATVRVIGTRCHDCQRPSGVEENGAYLDIRLMNYHQKLTNQQSRTPLGVTLFRTFEAAAPAFLAMYAFAAGLHYSAQLLATTERRIIASFVCFGLFLIFWLYLYWSKPSWTGPGGFPVKITRPKSRHWFFFAGFLLFTWAPAIPWLMPNSQLQQATALEIQRDLVVLEEKTRMADLLFTQMKDGEDSVEEFLKLPRKVQLLLPPPTPYANLAEHLQADLPHFSIVVPQRAAELAAAGGQFKARARIYSRLAEVEDKEREVVVGFRIWWEPYAKAREWSTPIGAYRRAFQYLIIGVYLRTLRDLQPDLGTIGLSGPPIPSDLAATKDAISDADKRRFDQGLPPELQQSDFVPRELHCCVLPPLR